MTEQSSPLPPHLERMPGHGLVLDKIKKRGWTVMDKPGVFLEIDKNKLLIDHEYQRTKISKGRVNELASNWSWMACGCILVVERDDGEWYVFDGQHRVLAALKRSDIETLPCLVFEATGVDKEAMGFVQVNTNRGNISAAAKYKGLLAANDPVAVAIDAGLKRCGLVVKDSIGSGSASHCVSCMGAIRDCWVTDAEGAEICLMICARIARDAEEAVKERVLLALFYLHRNGLDLRDKALVTRIIQVGQAKIQIRMLRWAEAIGHGGPKVWAEGVLEAINKGCRHRFSLGD